MANAGCINAYDCSGGFLRTLDNLQSSNIGVGVQYTAPNPLDDKKIDYIQYTDKCGCTCKLSGENEILIYATDGVIKDLTLTNDDVNEAIKIQWNDIFGSNRAKTIVRYKTGSYPVSITDGTLAVEETVKNQYSSTPFSLSGVLDETTYYISAFALDSNDTIINVQGGVITTNFLWGSYQKVEYIQSSGTQYINTNVQLGTNVFEINCDTLITQYTSEEQAIFSIWTGTYGYWNVFVRNYGSYYLDAYFQGHNQLGNSLSTNTRYNITLKRTSSSSWNLQNNTNSINISYSPGSTNNTTLKLFTRGDTPSTTYSNSKIRMYSCKIYVSGSLVRNFVPCYRKSDNLIGMLDIVNKVFYTNQGSGSFTKGGNV